VVKRNSEEDKLQRKKHVSLVLSKARRRTPEEIEKIKDQIREGIIANTPHKQLKEELKLGHGTFYDYLRSVQKEFMEIRIQNHENLVSEYSMRIEDTCQKLYEAYQETGKAFYLIERAKILDSFFGKLQSAGYIHNKQNPASINIVAINQDISKFLSDVGKERKVLEVSQ